MGQVRPEGRAVAVPGDNFVIALPIPARKRLVQQQGQARQGNHSGDRNDGPFRRAGRRRVSASSRPGRSAAPYRPPRHSPAPGRWANPRYWSGAARQSPDRPARSWRRDVPSPSSPSGPSSTESAQASASTVTGRAIMCACRSPYRKVKAGNSVIGPAR